MKNEIHQETLRLCRERAHLSQQALADKCKHVSKKTISRIENGKGENVRTNTLNELANALQVRPDELTRPFEKITSDNPVNRKFRAYVDIDVALAYELVEHRYNISYQSLVEMAPLFFTLLAEGSLAWRREKLATVDKAADHLRDWGESGGHPACWPALFEMENYALPEEEDSIKSCDLFGDEFSERADDIGFNPYRENPFSEYLKKLIADICKAEECEGLLALQSIDSRDDFFIRAESKMPGYTLCKSEIESITKGNSKAKHALAWGHVKISDIPEELQEDEASEKRIQWMIERIPQNELEKLEEHERFWEGILSLGKPSP